MIFIVTVMMMKSAKTLVFQLVQEHILKFQL